MVDLLHQDPEHKIVHEPLIGSGCRALYSEINSTVRKGLKIKPIEKTQGFVPQVLKEVVNLSCWYSTSVNSDPHCRGSLLKKLAGIQIKVFVNCNSIMLFSAASSWTCSKLSFTLPSPVRRADGKAKLSTPSSVFHYRFLKNNSW